MLVGGTARDEHMCTWLEDNQNTKHKTHVQRREDNQHTQNTCAKEIRQSKHTQNTCAKEERQ